MFLGFRSPNFAEDLAVREDAAGMTDEEREQRPLGGGEFYVRAVARDRSRDEIDDKSFVRKDGAFFARLGAALRGAEAGQELGGAEWLGHVIVGAGIERGDFVLLGIAHREDDDRRLAPFAQAAEHRQGRRDRAVRGRAG